MKNTILIQRIEGLAVFLSSIIWYQNLDGSWLLFVVLLLVIDVFMVGYVKGKTVGAHVYNLGHNYAVPLGLLGLGLLLELQFMQAAALIWLAHVGIDRAFGYGLKLTSGFNYTHLGTIGTQQTASRNKTKGMG